MIHIILLAIAGGIAALLNYNIHHPFALFQLGIAGPALITSYINGSEIAPNSRVSNEPVRFINYAHANDADIGGRIVLARGLFSDIVEGIKGIGAIERGIIENDRTKVIYYNKEADDGRVLKAINDFKFTFIGPVVVPSPNPYYKDLPTNAILCGDRTPRSNVRDAFRALIAAGVKIQQVGPFYKEERNSYANTIDLRSVGDREFFNREALSDSDINWEAPDLCGYKDEPRS